MTYEQVEYRVEGRVARVILNRPEYRNAQSSQLLRELDAALTEATADRDVRVILLSGAGEAFSSGHDLGTPAQAESLAARAEHAAATTLTEANFVYSWDHFLDMSLRWRDVPKPTIAAVHGWCIFGGWLIASAMDLIVAADDARFMTAMLQYFPLPYDVGPRKAKELLFDSHVISAPEAADLGFVNKVVPRADLEDEAMALAQRIATNSGFYLRLAKASVNQAQDAMGFRAAVQSAHAHYHLTEISNREFRRKQQAAGAEVADPLVTKRMPLVDKILREAEDESAPRL